MPREILRAEYVVATIRDQQLGSRVTEDGRESLTERTLRVAVAVAAFGFAGALLAGGPAGPRAIPGLAGIDVGPVEAAIGIVLVGTGLALALMGGSRAAGLLAVLAGVALLALVPSRSAESSDLRGPGQALSGLLGPALLGLFGTVAASGRMSRPAGWSIAIVLGLAGLVALLRLASYDPFADPTCVNCGHAAPALLGVTIGLRRLLDQAAAVLTIVAAACLVGLAVRSARSQVRPRAGGLVAALGTLVAGVSAGAETALRLTSTAQLSGPPEGMGAIEVVTALGGGLVVSGLAWWIAEVMRLRVRMRQLAVDSATAAELGPLEVRLAEALDDESVDIGYWLESEGRYVSRGGQPLDPSAGDVARTVTIERRGKPVAGIRHRQGIEPGAIRAELTPSFLVALDNERLNAAGMANLHALRKSRARLVSVQEQQRRQVERDLHDGIQQRLLSIVFNLRLARMDAERNRDPESVAWLERAETRTLAIVEEVRRLAHGIYPAILSQAGLSAALASLAELSPIPMTVVVEPSVHLPQPLEATVYQVIVDTLADSVLAGAGDLSIAVRQADGDVAVEIDHDGATASPRVRLVDRVAAAGGSVTFDPSESGSVKRLRVVLPCV